MAARVYSKGIFGLVAETGLYVQEVNYDYSIEEALIPGPTGDDVGAAYFNESATWTLSGFRRSDAQPDAGLGATIVIVNEFDGSEFGTAYAGGQTILTGAKPSRKSKEFSMLDLSGVFKPFLAALEA
jgi:hypothetical protein